MSESRPPPPNSSPGPGLQRPVTPSVVIPPGRGKTAPPMPAPGAATPPAPSTRTNTPVAPMPAVNPFQSQVNPQFHPPTGPQPAVPVAPGSQPRLQGSGTAPSMAAVVAPHNGVPIPTPGPMPSPMLGRPPTYPTGVARITVQYPQVGTMLKSPRGEYLVREVIGSGEFGAVYDCIGPFDQVYALKMVRPANRPYSEVQAEWAREQTRLFTLRHPNVVYIYDSFEQGHLFYLALERCDHALKDMLGTPMQEGLVIELTRQTLAAVQFLHDNDVVHDDLHGGNVLITHTDRPTVKISDFGISNELRGMPAVRPNVVHHAIMAPEILASGYTSRQSDLYQLGLLLYWMLTGEPAIQMDVPYQELVRQVAEGEPRKRAESLGTPLGKLIAKMLRRRE
ncbi:MAG TPA: protein kinase, partial [Labilithrix sp.]